ncbi:MAG: histidine kinase N-terminal 7TM domain-containing protein [Anaerolineales bacterium]
MNSLETLNRLFEAGIAITALSLFLRALTFNLRDRVSRAFAVILACIMVSFSGEAVSGALSQSPSLEIWLRLEWVGTLFLPAAYFHFADALLETTGRPSRGRRRLLVRLAYMLSAVFVALLPTYLLLGPLVPDGQPVAHLARTPLSWAFSAYYVVMIILAEIIIWRALQRTVLSASRRRMTYLFGGSLALAFGAFPFLILGSEIVAGFPGWFLFLAALANILVFWSIVAMAYATAFFGVPWPDRVVKSRLFRWLLRGPVTVFIVLALLPWVNGISGLMNVQEGVVLPILVALAILIFGHVLTLVAPVLENWIFFGAQEEDVQVLQTLQERVLTDADLRQFLEAVLAAVCDRFQTDTAFVAALDNGKMRTLLEVGNKDVLSGQDLSDPVISSNGSKSDVFSWGKFWLLPLVGNQNTGLLGLLGVLRIKKSNLPAELIDAMVDLGERAALALEDRRLQSQALRSLESLGPRVELIQRLRAAARYDQREVLSELADLPEYGDLVNWVKEALTHFWGGPRLTQSPLRGLRVVQKALDEHNGNPALALRAILREAIDRNKPAGEPRLTGEWMLYNLLEMKFMQGRKVREIAARLAMSEADLYRKQRVAIESVANSLLEMEKDVLEKQIGKERRR